jgi:DNA-binding beta-propeller fold protein YncE
MIPINDAYAATTFVDAFSVFGQETHPEGLAFNTDGTKMFVIGSGGDDVNEYACTAFDVSTCSFTDAFSVSANAAQPYGLAFNSDGTKMFVIGTTYDEVHEYTFIV